MPLVEYTTQIDRRLAGSPLDPDEYYDKTASDARYAPIEATTGVFSVLDYGAAADGVTNDMAAFRAAAAACSTAGGGVILVPPGTYYVEAGNSAETYFVRPPANSEVRMTGAVINVTARAAETGYYFLRISGSTISNVRVIGGTINLDRTGGDLTGEAGFGIAIQSEASSVRIEGVTIADAWGDCIIIGGSTPPDDVTIADCRLTNARRNCLSITYATNVTIRNCRFDDANGTSPQCGIDIEPNEGTSAVGVVIDGCSATGNAGSGIYVHAGVAGRTAGVAATRQIQIVNCYGAANAGPGINLGTVDDCTVTGNVCDGSTANSGIAATDIRDSTIAGNVCSENYSNGIYIEGALSCTVAANVLRDNAGSGLRARGQATGLEIAVENCAITGNAATGNTERGIYLLNGVACTVANNTVNGNGYDGLRMDNCRHCAVTGNVSAGNGSAAASTYYGIILAASSDNSLRSNVIRHTEHYLAGTAAAGGADTITFASTGDVSGLDDWYNGLEIAITGGTGSGQTATISDYAGSTRVATVSAAWATPPDATSTFEVRQATRIYRSLYFNSSSNRNWYVGNDCRYAAAITDSGTGNVTTAGNITS